MPKHTPYHFTVYLDDAEKHLLEELIEMLHVTRSDFFRTIIRAYHCKVRKYRVEKNIPEGRAIWINSGTGDIVSPDVN